MNLGITELDSIYVGTTQIGEIYLGDVLVYLLSSQSSGGTDSGNTPSGGEDSGDTPGGESGGTDSGDTGGGSTEPGGSDSGNTGGGSDSGESGGSDSGGSTEPGGDTPGGETTSGYTKFKISITTSSQWTATELGLVVNGTRVSNIDSDGIFTVVTGETDNFNFWGQNHDASTLFDGSTSTGPNGTDQVVAAGSVVFTSATAYEPSAITGIAVYRGLSWCPAPAMTLYGWSGSDWVSIGEVSTSSNGSGWINMTF